MKFLSRIFYFGLCSFISCALNFINAQEIKTACGTYTYHVPETESMLVAKAKAAQRARLEAIATEFGTTVSQDNTTLVKNTNGESSTSFYSAGGSTIKGEWLSDFSQPEYEFCIDTKTGMQVITASVCGKIREIRSIKTHAEARILRNGVEDKHESDLFNNGDNLYASFFSTVGGYLTMYWMSEDFETFPMLPYDHDKQQTFPIEANQRYVFFKEPDKVDVFENFQVYNVECEGKEELATVYFIFSQKEYEKPMLKADFIDFKTFNQWLSKLQQVDMTAQVIRKTFLIKNPSEL